MTYIGIIPARYASTRFPGKPLALIGDKPMIQHVYEQAHKALDNVVVATDDERIYNAVQDFGGHAVITRPDHRCGTERCLEAFDIWNAARTDDTDCVVVNIQGDEPFIRPEQIHALCDCFEGPGGDGTQIATLVRPYTADDSLESLLNPNTPKVTLRTIHTPAADKDQPALEAILFSRSVIPFRRGVPQQQWLADSGVTYYRHIGMYAYRADVLRCITRLAPSPLEQAESLEQLRWLENGYSIRIAVTHTASIGIDTPVDLLRAQQYLQDNQRIIK